MIECRAQCAPYRSGATALDLSRRALDEQPSSTFQGRSRERVAASKRGRRPVHTSGRTPPSRAVWCLCKREPEMVIPSLRR